MLTRTSWLNIKEGWMMQFRKKNFSPVISIYYMHAYFDLTIHFSRLKREERQLCGRVGPKFETVGFPFAAAFLCPAIKGCQSILCFQDECQKNQKGSNPRHLHAWLQTEAGNHRTAAVRRDVNTKILIKLANVTFSLCDMCCIGIFNSSLVSLPVCGYLDIKTLKISRLKSEKTEICRQQE